MIKLEEEAFITYLDEHGEKKEGYFTMVEEVKTGLRVHGNKNDFILPYARILRVKIRGGDGNDKE